MLVADSGGGLPTSGFGFEIPPGDPSALETAAGQYQDLVAALGLHSDTLAAAGRVTLGARGWQGMAASGYEMFVERLLGVVNHNIAQCGDAASALTGLATALQTAQTVTTQAMSDCVSAHSTQVAQQSAATEAGDRAQTAHQKATAAVHPAEASTYRSAATSAETDQNTAQAAANEASGALSTAQSTGQKALAEYKTSARAATVKLNNAANEMKNSGESPSTLETIVEWVGHLNDFGGAASVGVTKGYDAIVAVAAKRMISEIDAARADPAVVAAIKAELPISDGTVDPTFGIAAASEDLADNPLTKVLTKGLPEGAGVLEKVPYLGYALTAVNMFTNRDKGVKDSVVEPLGNLALGTAVTEGTASVVTPVIAGAAVGDGTLATILGASTFIPGVGEVVIVGGVTVAVVAGADWIFEHPGETLHGLEDAGGAVVTGVTDAGTGIADAATSTYHAAGHVVHDLEPWHW